MEEKIDILFVHHLPNIGGAPHSMMLIIKAAVERGLKCKVLFLRKEGTALEFYEKEGISFDTTDDVATYAHAYHAYRSFISRKPWHPITWLIRAFKSTSNAKIHLEKYKPKLVYLNTSVLIPFAKAAKEFQIPVVWHVREPLHSGNFGIRKSIIQLCFKTYPSKIISNSKMNANLLQVEPIEVIYNSVNFQQFDPDKNYDFFYEKIGLSKESKIITFLGGKVLTKGADLFIEAGLNALSAGIDCYFVVAGSFNLKPENGPMNKIEKKVAKLLEDQPDFKRQFIFTGALVNVAPLLGISNALIWASTVPHFARPIMEAMVMGVPIIASDDLSTSEIVTHNKDGLLVPINANTFAKGMQKIIANPEQAKRMGMAGRAKALKLFDGRQNNNRIIKEILKLID